MGRMSIRLSGCPSRNIYRSRNKPALSRLLFFFFFFVENKIETIQTNTVNSRGAGGSSSANKHLRKEDRVEAFPEQILVQTERQTRVCLSHWPLDLVFVEANSEICCGVSELARQLAVSGDGVVVDDKALTPQLVVVNY